MAYKPTLNPNVNKDNVLKVFGGQDENFCCPDDATVCKYEFEGAFVANNTDSVDVDVNGVNSVVDLATILTELKDDGVDIDYAVPVITIADLHEAIRAVHLHFDHENDDTTFPEDSARITDEGGGNWNICIYSTITFNSFEGGGSLALTQLCNTQVSCLYCLVVEGAVADVTIDGTTQALVDGTYPYDPADPAQNEIERALLESDTQTAVDLIGSDYKVTVITDDVNEGYNVCIQAVDGSVIEMVATEFTKTAGSCRQVYIA